MHKHKNFFHLHLISDATGETLIAAGRAVSAQFTASQSIEHVYPMIRSLDQMDEIIKSIDNEPGIVLYTIVDNGFATRLEKECKAIGVPSVSILDPIFQTFQTYLGAQSDRKVGAQHALDAEYYRRIDALNFTMLHDDGALPEDINDPDVILIGISRTSKTPTSIYLANRGIKTANIPLVPGMDLPPLLDQAVQPLIVALVASTDRIFQVRQNRLLGLNAASSDNSYIDRASIAGELAHTRKLCKRNGWPMIDVTRKSIEETAAAILSLLSARSG